MYTSCESWKTGRYIIPALCYATGPWMHEYPQRSWAGICQVWLIASWKASLLNYCTNDPCRHSPLTHGAKTCSDPRNEAACLVITGDISAATCWAHSSPTCKLHCNKSRTAADRCLLLVHYLILLASMASHGPGNFQLMGWIWQASNPKSPVENWWW